jgi:hypothetical protein
MPVRRGRSPNTRAKTENVNVVGDNIAARETSTSSASIHPMSQNRSGPPIVASGIDTSRAGRIAEAAHTTAVAAYRSDSNDGPQSRREVTTRRGANTVADHA